MEWSFLFIFNSILLGVGLAMDAFSVSMANGLHEPCMKPSQMCCIAGTFGFFQAFMPMTGWICVHTIVQYFTAFEKFIPIFSINKLISDVSLAKFSCMLTSNFFPISSAKSVANFSKDDVCF